MPEYAIRFGVANGKDHRAATWKCWTISGSGKSDVYLTCRSVGDIKLSLHDSGRWHVSFAAKRIPELFEPGSAPPSRFAGVWERAAPITDGLTLACRIHTPSFAANIPVSVLEPSVSWLPVAPVGKSVEVAVFLCDQPQPPNGWPGRHSMNTRQVGTLPLENGGCVSLVWSHCDERPLGLPPAVTPRFARGRSLEDALSPGLRAVAWGEYPDGSIVFTEGPVRVQRN